VNNLRSSGIDFIGSISWGTHIGQLYTDIDEYYETMIPFIKAGLSDNEMCTWIYSNKTCYQEVREKLKTGITDIDTYIAGGQLLIKSYAEWYFKNGQFDADITSKNWSRHLSLALSQGFDGLRVVGDSSWIDIADFDEINIYEEGISKNISELPFIAAWLYDARMLSTYEIAGVFKNHTFTIIRHKDGYKLMSNTGLQVRDHIKERSMEMYRHLVQLLPVSVIIHDDTRIHMCNQSAVALTGLKSTHELLGKRLLDLVPPANRSKARKYWRNALHGSAGSSYLQSEILSNRGEKKPVRIMTIPYGFDGSNLLLSVIMDHTPFVKINDLIDDVERHKQHQNLSLEYNRLKTEFFTNISHELRTPLNVILSVIQLLKLQSERLNTWDIESKYIDMMKQNCYRLIRLVNNLLDITRIDSNYFHLDLRNYDIIKLVRGITNSVAEYGKQRGLCIHFSSNSASRVMACDPDQIERVLLNLLSNAIKYTPSGGSIWVDVYAGDKAVEIRVKDTGIGIPKDKQEYIFDRFMQVSSSAMTREKEGSGIGLSLVKALVEMHNGTFSLSSEPGAGSEFVIKLPVRLIDFEEPCRIKSFPEFNHAERVIVEFSDIYS